MPALWCCDECSGFPFPPAQNWSQGRCSLAPGGKSSTPTWIFPWNSKCCHETRTQTLVPKAMLGTCSPLPSCPFLGHAVSPSPQSQVSVPILCSNPAAEDTNHSEKGPKLPHQLPTRESKCHQWEPRHRKSSPECSLEDISAAQLRFHLCVFFSPPLLSWSFKTNKVSRTRQRDNHPLIPFPRLSRLFGDSRKGRRELPTGTAARSPGPPSPGEEIRAWGSPFQCRGCGECRAEPGPWRSSGPALSALVVPALCSGDGTSARRVFHASVQTQYEMKNSYPCTRPEWIFS